MQRRSNAEYDDRRGSARERGYTREWELEAKAYLQSRPLCLGCEAVGRTEPAVLVDHVIPHKGDQLLFWDRSNRQPCCKWHHDVVKQKLELRYLAGAIDTDALCLDSAEAKAMTVRERTTIGTDGWPIS